MKINLVQKFILFRNSNIIFKKFLIKIIRVIYNIKNKYVNKIKNEIIRVLITNIQYWKLHYHLSKKTVESEFLDFIKDRISEPEVILELGSRDAIQSIEFSIIFPKAKIFTFECNPPCIQKCLDNIVNFKNIEIIPKAVSDKNGKTNFYPVITNIGAGSLFKASGKYDVVEKLPQKKIEVETTRIDTWARKRGINKIDLCWMDLQGAEYEALEGMGDLISNIQAMFVEVELREIYKGQKLFEDIKEILKKKGFSMIKYNPSTSNWWGNSIFLNDNLADKK